MNNQKIFLKSCLLVCILFMLSMAVFSQSRIAFYNFNARSNPHTVTLIDAILTDGELKQDIGIAGPTSEYEYRCSFLNATGLVIKSVNIKTPYERDPANCPDGQFTEGNLTIRTQYDPNAVTLTIEYPALEILVCTAANNIKLEIPLYTGSVSGKCSPMSPRAAAPSRASATA